MCFFRKKKVKKEKGYLLVSIHEPNKVTGGGLVNYIFNRDTEEFEKRKTYIPQYSDFFEKLEDVQEIICNDRTYKRFLGKPTAQIFYVKTTIEETDSELVPKITYQKLFYVPSKLHLAVWEQKHDE